MKISHLQRPLHSVFHIQLMHHMPKSRYENNGSSVHIFFINKAPSDTSTVPQRSSKFNSIQFNFICIAL
ncbi:hypothetical protein QTP70_015859 [Hemibagrus guttatus]|uniref:Uncharacterized protein n=1 Tax=Hemibagrus guttatus TaxID=175788 RepID=A0AAE0PQL2_9TELE|nr:hypothetical protein QTP70_015859 [Hemibagrus guttatus]